LVEELDEECSGTGRRLDEKWSEDEEKNEELEFGFNG
jgi:hypothetical protein